MSCPRQELGELVENLSGHGVGTGAALTADAGNRTARARGRVFLSQLSIEWRLKPAAEVSSASMVTKGSNTRI